MARFYTIWVASDGQSEVVFDAQPSTSDVLNCCESLSFPIHVDEVSVEAVGRSRFFTVKDNGHDDSENDEG